MKEVNKAFLFVSFLGILIPFGKLTLPNGGLLLLMFLESIDSVFIQKKINLEIFIYLILSIVTLISLLFILFEKKLHNLIGIVLQFIWLGYFLCQSEWKYLNDVFLLTTVIIYFILAFSLIFQLYFYKKKVINSN